MSGNRAPYGRNVFDEQGKLCDEIQKISTLLSEPKPDHISDEEWFLLNLQLNAMAAYSSILSRRISLL